MVAILQSDPSGFVAWFGILCSTWSAMSRGSTRRSYLCPLGLESVQCVAEGNIMVARCHVNNTYFDPHVTRSPSTYTAVGPARCCLMMALITCLNGIYILEQPRQSLLYRHPRFRWLTCIQPVGGLTIICVTKWSYRLHMYMHNVFFPSPIPWKT